MPLTNLCSRLVVTSTRWNASLPSSRLSPVRPPRPASRFPSSLRPSFHAPSSTATADGRCRPLRTLGSGAVGAAPPAAASATAPKGGSVSRAHGPCERCQPFTCPVSWLASASCRPLEASPGIPSSTPASQGLRRVPPAKANHALSTRGTFRRQVPPLRPWLAPRASSAGRHRYPRHHDRGPGFRHAFTLGSAAR
jgi:hypothetical protein